MITSKIRGQASLEYLIMLAILLAALLPLVWIATQNTEYTTTTTEISSALDVMTSTADAVYSLGPGSERTVRIFLPGAYEKYQAAVYGKEIILPYFIGGEFQEAYRSPTALVRGNPPTGSGVEYVNFRMTEQGYVLIGNPKIINFPAYISLTMVPGAEAQEDVVIKNIHSASLTVYISRAEDWITVDGSSSVTKTINSGANTTITVHLDPPEESGVYLNYITIKDSTTSEEYAWIPVRARIP